MKLKRVIKIKINTFAHVIFMPPQFSPMFVKRSFQNGKGELGSD